MLLSLPRSLPPKLIMTLRHRSHPPERAMQGFRWSLHPSRRCRHLLEVIMMVLSRLPRLPRSSWSKVHAPNKSVEATTAGP